MPGADWGASLIDALDQCRAVVLIFSASANGSMQIRNEVVHAVQRGVPVIPVRIEDIQPAKSLAYFMGSVHWLDALSPPLETHLKRLADSVKVMLQIEPPGAAKGEQRADDAPQAREAQPVAFVPQPPPSAPKAPNPLPRRVLPVLGGSLVTLSVIAFGVLYFQADWRNPFTRVYEPASSKQGQPAVETKSTAGSNQAAPAQPGTPPSSVAPAPVAQAPAAISALLLARLAALTPAIALPVRERVAREYAEARPHKAQAAGLGQNPVLWRAAIRENPQQAEDNALENC
jgi:hypothetical protein